MKKDNQKMKHQSEHVWIKYINKNPQQKKNKEHKGSFKTKKYNN